MPSVVKKSIRAKVHYNIDSATAQKLIGWSVTEEKGLLKLNGQNITCFKNLQNRPFDKSLAHRYAQDILDGNWNLNGESIIISDKGNVLSGQHRLIAVVLADLKWRENPELYPEWEMEPCIDSFIAYGISEDRETVNTIDTGKNRSLADAIVASGLLKKEFIGSEKKFFARGLQFAIYGVLKAIGDDLGFASKPSHSVCLDFLEDHPSIYDAVEVIQRVEKPLNSRGIKPMHCCSLVYLMAAGASDKDTYLEKPCEDRLNLHFDPVKDYFYSLASDHKSVKAVFNAIDELEEQDRPYIEKEAVLILGWHAFLQKGKVTKSNLRLKYEEVDGIDFLVDEPCCGNLDQGS